MKRFLGIVVACIFLASAAYAAEGDRKVGIVGEEKKADEKVKSDTKAGPVSEKKARDRKVGIVGEEKKPGEKAKSDTKAGPASESRGSKQDRKVGFEGEQKTSDKKETTK